MKTIKLTLLGLLALTSNFIQPKESGIILTSEIIHIVDGFQIPWGIDANVIKLMLHVRREIKKIQFGEQTKDGQFEGHYVFHDLHHSIRSLAILESKYEAEYYQKLTEFNKNPSLYHHELHDLNIWYNQIKQQLSVCLEIAKKEFEQKIASFSKNAQGGKDQMLILIEESCRKRNRNDCFLLKWAEVEEGNETKLMHEQINTFKGMDQFCTDLVNFLEDLMNSCKKAWAQFKKLMEKEAEAGHQNKH
jgi:hypothetical protein